MAGWLLGNYGGGWSHVSQSQAYVIATPFVASTGGTITAVRWYRPATGGTIPTSLKIWDVNSSSEVWSTGGSVAVPDNGQVGWQQVSVDPPLQLVAGREYRIAWHGPAGIWSAYHTSGLPTAQPGTSWTSSWRRWIQNASHVYPTTGDQQWVQGIDAYVDPSGAPPPDPTVTEPDLQNALASWLIATNDNTHQEDGLPWLTKTVVDAIHTIAQNIPRTTDAPWVTVLKLWEIAGALTEAEIAAWNLFAKRSPAQLTGGSGGGGSAFFGPNGTQVAAAAEQSEAYARWCSGAVLAAPFRTLVDQQAFSGRHGWAPGYPLFRIHLDNWANGQGVEELGAAGTWLPRVGWWAPVLPGNTLGERRWIEFQDQWLWPCEYSATGVVLFVHPSVSGTLYAYSVV